VRARIVSAVFLLVALTASAKERLGPIEAGAKLGEDAVVTSVRRHADAIYVRVRVANSEIVTYGIAGSRIFYVGDHPRTDAIERGAELLTAALAKAELTGDKLAAAVAERLAAPPPKLDAPEAAKILETLQGKWRVAVSKDGATITGTATRAPFLGSSVLREETDIPAALAAFSLFGFDRTNAVFWALELDPKSGVVTTAPAEWNADEQTMEFRLPADPEGTVHSVMLRIVSPTKHVLEQFAAPKGQPARRVKSATFER